MENTPGACRLRVGRVLGEDLLGRFDQHLDVFRFETEIRIQRPAKIIKEFPYCRVALVAGGDADHVQERYFKHAVFREKGGGSLARRSSRSVLALVMVRFPQIAWSGGRTHRSLVVIWCQPRAAVRQETCLRTSAGH